MANRSFRNGHSRFESTAEVEYRHPVPFDRYSDSAERRDAASPACGWPCRRFGRARFIDLVRMSGRDVTSARLKGAPAITYGSV